MQILWIFLLTTYSILAFNYLQDPGFDFDDEHKSYFMAIKFFLIVLLSKIEIDSIDFKMAFSNWIRLDA